MAKGHRAHYKPRPRLYPIRMKVCLSCDQYGWVMEMAAKRNCSLSQVVREAVDVWQLVAGEFENGALQPLQALL